MAAMRETAEFPTGDETQGGTVSVTWQEGWRLGEFRTTLPGHPMRSLSGRAFLASTLFMGTALPFLRVGRCQRRMARSKILAFVVFGLGASASCSHEGVIDNGIGLVWAGECGIHRPCKEVEDAMCSFMAATLLQPRLEAGHPRRRRWLKPRAP